MRSRDALLGLETMALAKRPLDAAFWDEFEEILLGADFGFATTEKIVGALRGVAKQDRYETSDQVIARFKRDVKNFLTLPGMELALDAKPMQEARAWIDRYRKFWEGNLDQFEKYLDKLQTKETKQDDHE